MEMNSQFFTCQAEALNLAYSSGERDHVMKDIVGICYIFLAWR